MRNHLKLALKVLSRRKFFTFVSLFGVTLTLTVLLVGTSMLDHLFVPQGVEAKLDRALTVRGIRLISDQGVMQTPAGYRFLDRYVRRLKTPEAVAVFGREQKVASYQGPSKLELYLKRTDGAYWRILDFEFVEGGPITPGDEADARFVAVINESTREKFFGNEKAVGRSIEIDGRTFRVAGVVRDVSWLHSAAFADVWVPISTTRSNAYRTQIAGEFTGLILGRSRADLPRIKKEFDEMVPTVEISREWDTFEAFAETRFEALARSIPAGNTTLLRTLIVAAALLFMTLPAINLVNLNLSRILERASEIGVRKAFGASRLQLVSQFIVENVVLTVIGGCLALAISAGVLALVNGMDVIPYAQLKLNLRVFGYGMLLAIAFGFMSGVYPAWKMSRLHPVQALKGGAR